MGKNLAGRTGFIAAVLVIFLYGIFGIPHGGLKQSILSRINLGLDLKGGTHLVLQVHVAEAINSQTDRDTQVLTTALAATGATATKLDPAHPETITVKGGSTTQQSAIHDILTGNDYTNYEVSSAPGGGYLMSYKQAAIRDLEARTLDTRPRREHYPVHGEAGDSRRGWSRVHGPGRGCDRPGRHDSPRR